MKTHLFFLCFLASILSGQAQNVFPEKFEGCNTDQFSLEKDVIKVPLDDQVLTALVMDALDAKTRSKIKGELMLQILVELDGSSCLLSMKNDTNIRSGKLKLKKVIDVKLQWGTIDKKVSPLLLLDFAQGEVDVKRLGVSQGRALQVIGEG